MCGTGRVGSEGAIFSTLPSIQPRPGVGSYSSPSRAIICMPTQMPRKGWPRTSTASRSASSSPGISASALRQAGKAPSPGSTMRVAFATASGSAVTVTAPAPVSAAIRSKAFWAECRFPAP